MTALPVAPAPDLLSSAGLRAAIDTHYESRRYRETPDGHRLRKITRIGMVGPIVVQALGVSIMAVILASNGAIPHDAAGNHRIRVALRAAQAAALDARHRDSDPERAAARTLEPFRAGGLR